jgi:hypothetical protein
MLIINYGIKIRFTNTKKGRENFKYVIQLSINKGINYGKKQTSG